MPEKIELLTRRNRYYAVNSKINTAILRIKDRHLLLNEICRITTEDGNFRMAWVGIKNASGFFEPIAWNGHEAGYLSIIKIASCNYDINSNESHVVEKKEYHICNDILANKEKNKWWAAAEERNYKSFIALPIIIQEETIGIFIIYSDQVNYFNAEEEINLLHAIAENISFALDAIETAQSNKQYQLALQESESHLKLLIENLNAGLVVHDANAAIILWNTKAVELLGLIPGQMYGKMPMDEAWHFINENGTKIALTDYPAMQVITTLAPLYNLVLGIVKSIGAKPVWVLVNAYPEFTPQRKLKQVVVNFVDITARKEAELALIESENKLFAFFNSSKDAIVLLDKDYSILSFNNKGNEIIELVFQKPMKIGSNITDFVLPNVREDFKVNFQKAFAGQEIQTERFLPFPSFSKWWSFTYTPIHNSIGEIFAIGLIISDIDATKRAEEALRLSEEKYRMIVETTSEGIYMIDKDGYLTFVNEQLPKMLGYSKDDDIIGSHAFRFLKKDLIPLATERLEKRKEGISESYDLTLVKKDGSFITAMLSSNPIFYEGVYQGALVVVNDITDRKIAEELLRESEQMFATAFKGSPIAISITSPIDGTIYDVNEVFLKDSGYTREELIGNTTLSLNFYSKESDRNFILSSIQTNGYLYNYECLFKPKNNQLLTCLLSSVKVSIKGKPLVLSYVVNITDRKNIETELRTSEEENRAIVNAIPDLLFRLDKEGIFIDFRASKYEELLAPPNFFLGKHISEVLPKNIADKAMQSIEKAISTKEMAAFEYEVPINGRNNFYEDRIVALSNGEVLSFIRNITERKTNESQLIESEQKFSQVFNNSPVPITLSALDGTFVDINKEFIVESGFTREEIIGHTSLELNCFVEREERNKMINEVQQHGSMLNREFLFRKKNGEIFNGLMSATIVQITGVPYLLSFIIDITERKTAEKELLKLNDTLNKKTYELATSNQELERFAYIASHDLQEPLRMITGFLQLFKSKYEHKVDELGDQYIQFAVNGADRMKNLIKDLLEYSRIGTNKEAAIITDLNQTVQEVLQLFSSTIEEEKIQITVPALPTIMANKTQMAQLFQNLIGNSIKYRKKENAIIQIEYTNNNENHLFKIYDNGIGIMPKSIHKIFNVFQRAHSETSKYPGTGIGLSICKKIVELHGGKISVESVYGKETTFFFSIPKQHTPHL